MLTLWRLLLSPCSRAAEPFTVTAAKAVPWEGGTCYRQSLQQKSCVCEWHTGRGGQSPRFSKRRIPCKKYIQNAANTICPITVYHNLIFQSNTMKLSEQLFPWESQRNGPGSQSKYPLGIYLLEMLFLENIINLHKINLMNLGLFM